MKAVVLAAGEGTRLRPLTQAVPKPMAPIANVPLLVRTLRLLAAQGFREIAVNLYHRPEVIRQEIGDGTALGVRLHYFPETELQGTAGGVKRMEALLSDGPFLVLYGDNLYHADFAPLVAFHREKKALASLATFTTPNPSACGLVVTDEQGHVTRFQEKPPPAEVFTDQANAGVYVLEPEVLKYIPAGTPFDFGRDVFPAFLNAQPGAMVAHPLGGYLQDTGTLPAYRQANWDVLDGTATGGIPQSGIAPTAQVSPTATLTSRNVLGSGVLVEEGASLTECILWDGCRIGAGARLTNVILGTGVQISAGAVLQDIVRV